ncbi:DUF4860 domain-containing protein [Eubacterium oxidoreducens]|uniref:DUF4860 domain-containing protein n=1 Tax=Eubacterium oxidoreducens TaxID=1732 RepID=A0A1G6BLL3_EUBOX|nr:DUF4860 domain-containing protein [Eubacterium oxidoreducens]SDB21475.1 protein of unknown function [Eubacterium oxidoreducens]
MPARKKIHSASISMLILYGILIVALLFLTMAGCRLYTVFTDKRLANEQKRATLSYLQAKVASLDAQGAITIEDGPEKCSDMLVLAEGETQYETRIFVYNGQLMELFTKTTASTDIQLAEVITSEEEFEMELNADGSLLRVETSQGTAMMAIRSAKGGTDERTK